MTVSVPVAAGIALSFGPVVNSGGGALVPWILCLFVTCTIALMLDATRSALLSRELVAGAIVADACALVFLGSLFALGFFHGSEFRTLYGWAVALFGALLIAIGYLLAKKRVARMFSSRAFARPGNLAVGRHSTVLWPPWGSLLPIFVAALVVGGMPGFTEHYRPRSGRLISFTPRSYSFQSGCLASRGHARLAASGT